MRTDEKQFEITSTRSLTYWCYLKRYRSLTVSTVQTVGRAGQDMFKNMMMEFPVRVLEVITNKR